MILGFGCRSTDSQTSAITMKAIINIIFITLIFSSTLFAQDVRYWKFKSIEELRADVVEIETEIEQIQARADNLRKRGDGAQAEWFEMRVELRRQALERRRERIAELEAAERERELQAKRELAALVAKRCVAELRVKAVEIELAHARADLEIAEIFEVAEESDYVKVQLLEHELEVAQIHLRRVERQLKKRSDKSAPTTRRPI